MILAVDEIMDMARTAINVIGNGLAACVIARWEGVFGEGRAVSRTRERHGRRRGGLTAVSAGVALRRRCRKLDHDVTRTHAALDLRAGRCGLRCHVRRRLCMLDAPAAAPIEEPEEESTDGGFDFEACLSVRGSASSPSFPELSFSGFDGAPRSSSRSPSTTPPTI